MSAIPARRQRSRVALGRVSSYLALALVLGCCGWLFAAAPDTALVPATAVVALAAALALLVVSVRLGMLTSPVIVLAVPLLLSLAAAMTPITRIFGDWSTGTLTTAILIATAPLVGASAMIITRPFPPARLERGTDAAPHPQRLVVVCLAMCLLGASVNVFEWSAIGGPPLFSDNIDATRVSLDAGVLHVFALGIPLALLIATWARIARPQYFSILQLRCLEATIATAALIQGLGGGRSLVIVPLLAVLVVSARYVSPRTARRGMIVIPIVLVGFACGMFVVREAQHANDPVASSVLYNASGAKSSPLKAAFDGLAIGFGQQLRVVAELQDANIKTEPFTTSIWFAHNFSSRAVDPHTVTGPNAGNWLTSTYAGPLLLDFGLIPAVIFGLAFGAAAHLLYLRFVRGRSVTIIWIYAYLAGPIATAFYINLFLYFVYPILDLIGLFILSRLLIKPEK